MFQFYTRANSRHLTGYGPKLTLISVNIEGMALIKKDLLQEICKKQKCDILWIQETH